VLHGSIGSEAGYDAALLLATAYRIVYGIAGSYVTARLAPDRPMQHALLGGFIGLALSIVGAAGDLEWRPSVRPALVIRSHSWNRSADRLGRRQTPSDAAPRPASCINRLTKESIKESTGEKHEE